MKNSNWSHIRRLQLLELFYEASKKVPAYKKFLKQNQINSKKITTFEDFQNVPPMSKNNYLRQYPLFELCLNGTLKKPLVFTSTSGSTGEPFYFPRGEALDSQYSEYCKMFFNYSTNSKKTTLVIVAFGMGVWIGGLITYEAFKHMEESGTPLSIITPGVNKKEIFDAMKNIAPQFDRIILCGYPPFIKDVIDCGKDHGVNWKNHDIKLLFAAESFSEKFRDYLGKKIGLQNIYRDTMNIYGSADLGGMAKESPMTILIRRLALKNKNLYKKLFIDASRLPTLAEYNPYYINFESYNKSILVSGMNSLPLIRYEIGDNGGVMSYEDVASIFKSFGIDLYKEAKKIGIEKTITGWPMVYVYERTDFSTKLYGAIIYPEYVKIGLEHPDLEDILTGKFTMFTKYDRKQNEYLEINLELKPGKEISGELSESIKDIISSSLKLKSAEHKNNADNMKEKVDPRLVFWEHNHPQYFQPTIKQKWINK